ncbi:MAG: hypothetical protein KTR25_02495 [Myxococcales bacterium]|nr:hypothetical protein [Myxococcales bacterium]
MHPILNRNLFFVKEHIGAFKASNSYDVLDPETGDVVLHCREENLSWLTKLLRFSRYKRLTPFNIHIRTPSGEPVLRVHRGTSFILSNVSVVDNAEQPIGGFRQKIFSIGGAFEVLDGTKQPVCELKGSWTSWNFRFLSKDRELAWVDKKWTGMGKELFTSADNYVLRIAEDVPPDHSLRQLIFAAVMCIDMVLKE